MTPSEQRADLERRIQNASSIEFMRSTEGWAFMNQWLQDSLATADGALKSRAFVDDHNGYLNARALYAAYQEVTNFIEGTIEDGIRSKAELDELDRLEGGSDYPGRPTTL